MLLLLFSGGGGGGGFSAPYGLATETDSAFAPTLTVSRSYGLATETDTALVMGGATRLSGVYAEVVASWPSEARLSGVYAEVVGAWPSEARLSGVYVEVVRSINTVSDSRRRQAMFGSF